MVWIRFLIFICFVFPELAISQSYTAAIDNTNSLEPISTDLLWISGVTNKLSAKQGVKQASDCLADNTLANPQCDLVRYIQTHHESSTSIAEAFTKQVVYVGERHISDQAKKILTQNLKSLKEAGYETLAMEMWNSSAQDFIDQFLNELIDPLVFEKTFHEQWSYNSTPYLDLMMTAKKEGFKILAIDVRDQIDKSKKYTQTENLKIRDESMAETISQYLKNNSNKKVIVFCGKLHAYSRLTNDGAQKSQIELLFQKANIQAQSVIIIGSRESSPLSFAIKALSVNDGIINMDPNVHFTNTVLFTSEL